MIDLLAAKSNTGFLFVVILLAAFVFLVLLPRRRQQRAQRDQLATLEPGQEVLTVGGLIGHIVEVGDQTLKVEIADGVVVRVARRAIAGVIPPDEPELEPEEADESEPEREPVEAEHG